MASARQAEPLELLDQAGTLLRQASAPANGTGPWSALRATLDELREALEHPSPANSIPLSPPERETPFGVVEEYILRYAELFEYAADGYVVTDVAANIVGTNQMAARLLDRPKDFLLGKPLPFCIVPEQRRAFYNRLIGLRWRGELIRDWEVRLVPRGRDAPVDVLLTVTPIPGREGEVSGLRWTLRDARRVKRAEETLRAEREILGGLLDLAPVLILLVDVHGRILRPNAYLGRLSGRRLDELSGEDWLSALFVAAEWPRAQAMFAEALNGEAKGPIELHLKTAEGDARITTWHARLVPRPDRNESAVLLVGHDLTEVREAQEQALRAARLAAIGQIAAGLAHEGRNALQRSQACLDRAAWRLQEQSDVLDLVRRAQQAQQDLVYLFEDVRSYAAPLRLDLQFCDLAEVCNDAWENLASLREGRDAQLSMEASTGSFFWLCDRPRMQQVFRILLENALDACSDPMRIDIVCRETPQAGRHTLQITVRNNGPDLTAEQRRRIFEPFFTTKLKGTGLGMAIARRIVEAHGGGLTLGAADRPGAEFVLTLPRSVP
jgi:PAS domain S-box-containing protein